MVKEAIFSHTIQLGGRIAAEHGIGILKKEYLGLNLDSATLGLAMQIKKMLDPKGILNPGKVFPQQAWNETYQAVPNNSGPENNGK